ncbi:MAG: hypothetical protein AAB353_01880 [Candidatus Hydrogenedentota bacterium]
MAAGTAFSCCIVLAFLLLAPSAHGQRGTGIHLRNSIAAIERSHGDRGRFAARSVSRGVASASPRIRNTGPGSLASAVGSGGTPILDALRNSIGNNVGTIGARSSTPLLDALREYTGAPSGTGYPLLDALRSQQDYAYRRDNEYIKAQRDAVIANAVVNVVGIIADASGRSRQSYPAHTPSGSFVQERIVLEPAHYETERVWVGPLFDPHTGRQLGGGFYETRTHYVPETYGLRDVWIPRE